MTELISSLASQKSSPQGDTTPWGGKWGAVVRARLMLVWTQEGQTAVSSGTALKAQGWSEVWVLFLSLKTRPAEGCAELAHFAAKLTLPLPRP